MAKINLQEIENFLNGKNPMQKIVSIECGYGDEKASIIYINEQGKKMIQMDDFKPFVWAKNSVAVRMFDGDRNELKKKMIEFGISVKALKTEQEGKTTAERLENGYKYLFYAKRKMSFQTFLRFFQMAKTPIYGDKKKNPIEKTVSSKEFLAISPVEQYMIASGKRLFKGFDNYDELKRLLFDLETQGLNPEIHAIDQIGVRTNKGFEKVITVVGEGEERKRNELQAIIEFLEIIYNEKPDIVAGHNSENFDWNFIIVRCQKLGTSLEELSSNFFRYPIYKKQKESVLKLGGEVEYYKPTIMWGTSIVDSLHAVRRAQAIDSSMKLATLKYVTKYLGLKKENRVYVKGNIISQTWSDNTYSYAFNNTNGDWYKITEQYPLKEGYEKQTGKYIVERYLLDDIWETDKIELRLNESNFLINKILPTTFQRACTMGTAGIWKLIILAWCYEQNVAVPAFGAKKRFTGGLSRLLKVGYADNVVKLDYNSLYPSIDLSWNVASDLDITNALLMMLEYVLTNREKYKDLKGDASAKAKAIKKEIEKTTDENTIIALTKEYQKYNEEAMANDKKQLPLKILANSFFGSYGSPDVFPFGDVTCAEMTTCIGRQCLRLMISHFTSLGYTPIVGDSVLGCTPLFIKYNDTNLIDIKSIEEIVNLSNIQIDEYDREYDTSFKPFKVLCRSGWSDVRYIYRHKTVKPIYTVLDGNTEVSVTEDHSLFDENKKEIKPSEINETTKLEYYTNTIKHDIFDVDEQFVIGSAKQLANGNIDRVPTAILNANVNMIKKFLDIFNAKKKDVYRNKVCMAGLLYLNKTIKNERKV